MPDYNDQEGKLIEMIEVLNGELLDIEIKLQNALKISRDKFIAIVVQSITRMRTLSEDLFKDVAGEVGLFYDKLKEQCIAERESLLARIEANEDQDQVMQDYPEEAHEFIVDVIASEDKEMLSDILNHFKEQIDAKLAEIDGGITRNLQKDW